MHSVWFGLLLHYCVNYVTNQLDLSKSIEGCTQEGSICFFIQ